MYFDQKADSELQGEESLPGELAALFGSYRDAHPDAEGSANFMPGLWARIDARRRYNWTFRRLTRAFVTMSGVVCLVIAGAMWTPSHVTSPRSTWTYVDVLAGDNIPDEAIDADAGLAEL